MESNPECHEKDVINVKKSISNSTEVNISESVWGCLRRRGKRRECGGRGHVVGLGQRRNKFNNFKKLL